MTGSAIERRLVVDEASDTSSAASDEPRRQRSLSCQPCVLPLTHPANGVR